MKKHLSLYVLLAALCFTLSPQKARAQVDEYLCVKGSATINIKVTGTPEEFPDLWYSTDKTNWTQITGATNWNTPSASSTVTYFKGHNPNGFNHSSTNFVSIAITGGNPALGGNIMSLIDDVNFATNNSTIPCDYCFYALFCPYPPAAFSTSYSSTLTAVTYLYHAKDMVLPATNLTSYCYAYLLAGNSGLYNGPQLPAMVMQPWCYAHMFDGCYNNFYGSTAANSGYYFSSMTLPAQQLAEGCYAFMFNRCAVLYNNDANNYYVLPAEELAPKCYMGMFGLYNAKCTSLKYVEIMATSLQDRRGQDFTNCMAYMFNNAIAAGTSYGRGGLTVKMYWLNWGAYTNGATGTGPTQSWFYGYSAAYNTFLYQTGLTPTTKGSSSSYPNTTYSNPFPYSSTLTAQNYTYLTFNCAANGGTWEEDSEYNTDLRRVVRADYTAKTIPAPPVKENARFLGWFTTASGEGSMLTESQLKQITTATTVFARFVDDSKYTFFVNPSDKGTITVTDNNSTAYTPGTLYILDSNDKTFTLSCTGVTSGYSFYRWIGGQVDDNTVTFREGQKDLTVTGIITGTPNFGDAAVTVYQVGTGAGTSNAVPLPAEAVDLGAAGIWAKYNVDKTTASGFAASETATGGYYSWGMDYAATEAEVNAKYSSMTDGQNLPVTEDADVAYKYCGHQWRIPTKDEWETLLNNSSITYVNTYNAKISSNSNGNYITLGKNGYYSGTSGPSFSNSIQYWSATRGLTQSSGNTAYGFGGGVSGSTVLSPVFGNNTVGGTGAGYYKFAVGIRPILNVNKRVLTINSNGHTYTYNCDLYQTVTVTAEADEDEGFRFARWKDEAGNVVSTTNPLVVNVYDNLTYTAEFEELQGDKYHVTFYDEDGITVLFEEDRLEGLMPKYKGSTPTKTNWFFNGWSPALQPVGTSDVSYTATYRSIESADAFVDVYQNVSSNSTKILYYLPVEKEFNDGNKYSAIDMGYGVAWADRNVGAIEKNAQGGWYQWGGETPDQTANVAANNIPSTGGKSTSSLDALTDLEDVAKTTMGANWHMPNRAEWNALKDNTDIISGSIFTNRTDNLQTITLQTGGYYYCQQVCISQGWWGCNQYGYQTANDKGDYCMYWVNERSAGDAVYLFHNTSGVFGVYAKDGGNSGYDISPKNVMQIRAIYEPSYTTYTLTINVGSYSYQYICQAGQSITVTANATTSGNVFDKWLLADGSTPDNVDGTLATRTFVMTENITRTATFKEAPLVTTYDVTIESSNTSYGTVDVAAIDDVESGTEISVNGTTLTIGETTVTATKTTDDAQYTYTFAGWTDNSGKALPESVTADLAIRANFTQSKKQYTLTWNFDGGTTATADGDYTHGSVEWGTTIKAPANPTKGGYDFAGWDATPASTMPAATTTYTAQWTAQSNDFDLYDDKNEGDDFYKALKALIGKERNVRYMRTLAAKQWCVFSLPFSLDLLDTSNPFYDCVYTFDGATYEADGTLSFNFIANTVGTEANKPYIYYSSTGVTNPVFNQVTIVASEESAANSVKLDNSEVNTVSFVNTIVRTKLTNLLTENKRLIYINNNTLYYPKDDSNVWMRAFRGYFKLNNVDIRYVNPRVRIVMDGQTVTEIETAGATEDASVRKYVQDGMLLIERNGVVYNAQGAVVR